MAKIGVHFLVLFFGLVYNFYKWLYFLLLVDCSHYGCHPSMKVVPQFFPVARNFLLRALRMFRCTQGKGFPLCLVPHPGLCCLVSIQFYRKGLCSLRRKAVDRKGQSGTRLKNSIWNLSLFVTSKKRFKSKTFQHFPALPLSDSGAEVVIKVTPLVLWPFS